MYLKKIFIFLLLFFFFINSTLANIEARVIFKINNDIITSIDLENEKKFLLFLNDRLKDLNTDQIDNIAKDSLKNRKIKIIELKKFINLNQDELGDIFMNDFIANTRFKNEENLKKELDNLNLDFNYFFENIKIDNLWREFVFNKFSSQIKINIEKLGEKIKSEQKQIEELNLSEILFTAVNLEELNKKKKLINDEIKKSNFEAAASLYSISETKNIGGNLGWIPSNQIADAIYSEINNSVEVSNVIKTSNGYLILKVNQRRKIDKEINFEEELKKLVKLETQKELNRLGYIYFNKIKKRVFISEN